MHLAPRDLDKLTLHAAGTLAQKRLARGVRLNYPEAVALIATQLLEFIRDGRTVAELMDLGRRFLGRRQVMSGVAELVYEVQVEGTFPDGSKLVTVHHPIVQEDGDLNLALYGSFLPVPSLDVFGPRDAAPDHRPGQRAEVDEGTPGEIWVAPGELEINAGRTAVAVSVTHVGDRPIQVGSHYPFWLTNAALQFDRTVAQGKRLDIPAGTAVRFEPGDSKTVQLIPTEGASSSPVDSSFDVTAASAQRSAGKGKP